MQKITTSLWFETQAEEAMLHYVSLLPDARVLGVSRFGEGGPGPAGSVMSASFQLAGQEFVALNGGPKDGFTESISLLVRCESQAEVDRLWAGLSEGGEPGRCGWLKDKFGVSWQVIPTVLLELLQNEDAEKAGRAMQAMLQMSKLDIAALQRASEG